MRHRHHSFDLTVAITGGGGFIGHRLAERFLSQGAYVAILDDLSSPYAAGNIARLKSRYPSRVRTVTGDVREGSVRTEALAGSRIVFHLAAQANCAGSMAHPRRDFEVNARATGELIADLMRMAAPPDLVFASGREVYGSLRQVDVEVTDSRLEAARPEIRRFGLPETTPVNVETPLGCSKLAAEQHVQWAATKGLRTVVLRLGAVYGPQRCGADDSDFVAEMARGTANNRGRFLRGDGRQVRDWLYLDDAAEALAAAARKMDRLQGGVFHAGGGPANAASERELLAMLAGPGKSPMVCHLPRLAADPDYFVCDNRRFAQLTGWRPRTRLLCGTQRLRRWAASELSALTEVVA